MQRHIRNCTRAAQNGKPPRALHKPRAKKLPYLPRSKSTSSTSSSSSAINEPECPLSPPLSSNGSENASKGAAAALAAVSDDEKVFSLPSPPALALSDEIASITIPHDDESNGSSEPGPAPYMSPSDLMECHRSLSVDCGRPSVSDSELMPPPFNAPPSPQLSIFDDETVASWSTFFADERSASVQSCSLRSIELNRSTQLQNRVGIALDDTMRKNFVSLLQPLCNDVDFNILIPSAAALHAYVDMYILEVDSVFPIIHHSFFEYLFILDSKSSKQTLTDMNRMATCEAVLLLAILTTGAAQLSQDTMAVELRLACDQVLVRVNEMPSLSMSEQLPIFQAQLLCHLFDVWRGDFGNVTLYLDDTATKLRQNISTWNKFCCEVAEFVMINDGNGEKCTLAWQAWISRQSYERLFWACADLMSMIALVYGQQPLLQEQQRHYQQKKNQKNESSTDNSDDNNKHNNDDNIKQSERQQLAWMNEFGQPPLPESEAIWLAQTAEEWEMQTTAVSARSPTGSALDNGEIGLFTVSIFLHAILDYYRKMARSKASKRAYLTADTACLQQQEEVEEKIFLRALSVEEVDILLDKLSLLVLARNVSSAEETAVRRCKALVHTCRLRQREIRSAADIFGNIYFKDEFQIDLICTLGRNGKRVQDALTGAIEYAYPLCSQENRREIHEATELQGFWDACLYIISWLAVIDAVSESGGTISSDEREIIKQVALLIDPTGDMGIQVATELQQPPAWYCPADDDDEGVGFAGELQQLRQRASEELLRTVTREFSGILERCGTRWGLARDMAVVLKRSVLCISS